MEISIPEFSLILLIGPSGAGKTTFAQKHFPDLSVVSSDACRRLIIDDPNDQSVSADAFELVYQIVAKRLKAGKLTVVDATNVRADARLPFLKMAREFHCRCCAIVLDIPLRVCIERIQKREGNSLPNRVIRGQRSQLHQSIRHLKQEGFRHVYVLNDPEQIDAARVVRVPLAINRRHEHGPFDFIGDVHGCATELECLLEQLGYERVFHPNQSGSPLLESNVYRHPSGRKAVFVGDLVDRGPRVVDTLRLVATMVDAGTALCVAGNHDDKLLRNLDGKETQLKHGLAQTMSEIEAIDPLHQSRFREELKSFLEGLVSHYVLDNGELIVAHAGLKEELQGRVSGQVREFALYGATTGEKDELGFPIRLDWADDYSGKPRVIYGHTTVLAPEWNNRTVNIDTGCVFGGALTALRYPEMEFVSKKAISTYYESSRPIGYRADSGRSSYSGDDGEILNVNDLLGDASISTSLQRRIVIPAGNAAARFEALHRLSTDPGWLIYLPPTMSPSNSSLLPNYLEHPHEAFDYYRKNRVQNVICQEKHMGSRSVVIVCKDEATAKARFGVSGGESGVIFTRTGRRFFSSGEYEQEILVCIHQALTTANFWEEFRSDWFCFDCELMPWSEKAQELLRNQYAKTGAAGRSSLQAAIGSLQGAADCSSPAESELRQALLNRLGVRQQQVQQFVESYRQYCWKVQSVDDVRIAPFHFLASQGQVHTDKDHRWHMETLARLCEASPCLLHKTNYIEVDLADESSREEATQWWLDLTGPTGEGTAKGLDVKQGEGMVVKPLDWIVRGPKGLVQPAIKCRGREYLRLTYGPEYDSPKNLDRLRSRNLGRKRDLALKEFSLGLESLERFVRGEPSARVQQCVYGVLALEMEPIDPRL